MDNGEKKIEELKQKGYNSVYTWSEKSGEKDPGHMHGYDTRLVIIEGEIEIEMDGRIVMLKVGDEIDIPRGKVHHAKAGPVGCKYIIAEKH